MAGKMEQTLDVIRTFLVECSKLRVEELHGFYVSPNIIREIM